MENADRLADLDRAAAQPFITPPPTPAWYPPLVGAFWAAIVGGVGAGRAGHTLVGVTVIAVAAIALGAFFGWYRRRWGTWPNMSQAPAEIRQAYQTFYFALVLAIAVGVLGCFICGAAIAAALTFAACTPVVWWYERRVYPAACNRVRNRLS